ncbi:DNA replication and repair protein RecF [Striga asiatica]|uniref:DNA replication and repair protein RecF n=1 Tax=Striga asiatica TaxID=4170 RepID=A0A5A7QCC4_STRAF|nr:DNA replication and repair protein RecF [Striga asiatica]
MTHCPNTDNNEGKMQELDESKVHLQLNPSKLNDRKNENRLTIDDNTYNYGGFLWTNKTKNQSHMSEAKVRCTKIAIEVQKQKCPRNTLRQYLLRVPAVCDRLVVVIFKKYVAKATVGHIFDNMPFDGKLTTPPILLLPVISIILKVNRPNHLSYTTKLATSINLQVITTAIIKRTNTPI